MGDFYELFGEDAERAAPILELTLTSRDKGKNNFPMAGFPHHAAPSYIAKLIEAGHKVAMCDQLENPALAKGIVKRDITRIVTPGLLLEDETLTAGNNNYLLALWGSEEQIGLAALDLSTGDFVCTVTQSVEQVFDELLRLSPELVPIDDEWHREHLAQWQKLRVLCHVVSSGVSEFPKAVSTWEQLGLLDSILETSTYLTQ